MHDLDNTIEDAALLDFDDVVEIKIKPEGNRNWFKVESPGQGYIRVSAKVEPEDVQLKCYFALYEEWEDDKINRISDHLSFPAAVKVDEGTYHFVVRDYRDNDESDEIIPLKAEFIEEFDPFERNHESADAKEISLDSEFQTAIFPRGDVNWFKTKVDTAGIIQLMGRNVPGDINLLAKFYEYDEWASPKVSSLSDHLSVPCGFAVHEAGEYYFRLKDKRNNDCAQKLIDMRMKFLKQKDKYEPNYPYTKAKEVKDGDILNIAIFPKGDVDYFKIIAESSGTLSLQTRGNTGELDLASRLYKADPDDPSQRDRDSDRKQLPCEFDVEGGETYYFYIKDKRHNNELEDLFELKVEVL